MSTYNDELQKRFERLTTIILAWEAQLSQMPKQAIDLFQRDDLMGIRQLIEEKQRLRFLIQNLKIFVSKWENIDENAMKVARSEDEN